MGALAKNIARASRGGEVVESTLAASTEVFGGSLLEYNAGKVKPAAKAANKVIAGVALAGAESGAADTVKVPVRRRGTFHFAKSGTAVVGEVAYIVDDDTVTDVAAGSSKVGRIVDSDDDGVWVELTDFGV